MLTLKTEEKWIYVMHFTALTKQDSYECGKEDSQREAQNHMLTAPSFPNEELEIIDVILTSAMT